jgi:DNA-directed RNA polymerase II subunit RPB1
MNAHIPQSYEAHTELEEIAAVPMQIIRPRDGQPVIGVVQDTLVGAHLATKAGNRFNRREFMNLMMRNKRFHGLPTAGDDGKYTGQQVISTMLAPVNMKMNNGLYDANKVQENTVIIEEGEVKQGVFDKGTFNKPGAGIVHTTYNDYGPKDAVQLIDSMQNVLENYLIMKGFSVGISDLVPDEETKRQMEEKIAVAKAEVADIAMQVHMDLFTNNTGKSNQDEFEARVNGVLARAFDAGKIGQTSLSSENRLIAMINAGSKGSSMNIAQMLACVGPVSIDGKRIAYGFADRTLPHYKKFDDGPEARGFVESCFLRGLTPQEFFFHAMSGREGLIDTAVKTSDTGYTQRQLIKAMEDVMIQHDGTVRDAAGAIIQFHYGEDGTNSTKIESSAVPMEKGFDKADTDIIAKYSMNGLDLAPYLKEDTTRESDAEALLAYANEVAQDRHMIIQYVYGMSKNSQPINTPLNLERIILNMKTKFGLRAQTMTTDDQGRESPANVRTNLTPLTVLNGINAMIKKTQPYNKIWVASLRFFLAPHKMIVDERFTQEAWDALVETIVVKNYKSWAVPGELVGIIAAQSIGEPTTQMTLNTFHLAGVAAKSNMTRGVPRVKELLKVTRNPKATSLTVYMKPAFRQNKDAVREVLQDFELTLLKDIVQKSAIYYDPHERETIIEEDRELIEFYNLFEGLEPEEKKSPSKWLLRLTFDRELMFNKNITMDDVNVILSNKFGEQVKLTYSDYNSQRLIMRIRINPGDNTYGDDLEGLKKFQNKLLNSVIMRGLPGIKSASMRKYSDMLEYDGSKYSVVDQYIIDTDGSNYTEVMAHPAVDGSKLYSTNVHDINEHLGIEATRQALYIELKTVFEDANVNYRHMGLLVDVMTRGGKLMSIDRYGINKINIGPLAKASFEETEKMLMKAALFGEVDPVTGVSANIMMGQTIRGGTAFSQIMLDEASLPRLLEGLPAHPEADEDEDIVQLSDTNIGAVLYEDPNDACSKTRLQMNFVLPKSKTMIEEEDEDDVEFKVK